MADEEGNGTTGTVTTGSDGGPASASPYDQDEKTVRVLRFGVAAIGLLLPLVLPIGNWIFVQFGHHTDILPSSMSSSYYTSTRNIFVGSLCALGIFLIGYRTSSNEDLASTVVGVFAIGVALFPTAPKVPTDYQSTVGYIHLSCAAVLLSGLAGFCIMSFHNESKAKRQANNQAPHYAYLVAGVLILVFLAIAVIAGVTHWGNGWKLTPLYACEALSVWAFGAAWLAAALEIHVPSSSSAAAARKRRSPRRRALASPQH